MPLLNGKNLDGKQKSEFNKVLRNAFVTPPDLNMMLQDELN